MGDDSWAENGSLCNGTCFIWQDTVYQYIHSTVRVNHKKYCTDDFVQKLLESYFWLSEYK